MVLLFSLHSRACCGFPAHPSLAVAYMSVLDALALVDPTTSEPITLEYVVMMGVAKWAVAVVAGTVVAAVAVAVVMIMLKLLNNSFCAK